MIKLGQTVDRSYELVKDEYNGKIAYKIVNRQKDEPEETYLVRQNLESGTWEMVDRLEEDVPHRELRERYGFWKAPRVIRGGWFLKLGLGSTLPEVPGPDRVTTLREEFDRKRFEGDHVLTTDIHGVPRRQFLYYSNVISSGIRLKRTPRGTKLVLEERSLISRRGTFNPW